MLYYKFCLQSYLLIEPMLQLGLALRSGSVILLILLRCSLMKRRSEFFFK